MLSKYETGKKRGEDSGNGKLLHEIEAISKALYLDKKPSKSLAPTVNSRSKSAGKYHLPDQKTKPSYVNEEPAQKDRKSFWSWKPLKALSHIRNRRFNCCFSLQIHSIEGLPPSFSDVSLFVHWKRRDGELRTRPVKVLQGIAEFEEKLTHVCSVYGSRSGPHHSAKYESKHFLLYASIYGSPEIDLGKHRVDLTRLLPLTLEELEEEKNSGKWTTSFKLSGKARGAIMNVSFGYSVLGNNASMNSSHRKMDNNLGMIKANAKLGQGNGKGIVRHTGSLPSNSSPQSRASSRSVEDIKVLHEIPPVSKSELSSSINLLYQKLDEENLNNSVNYNPELDVFTEHMEPVKRNDCPLTDFGEKSAENDPEHNEFTVIEHGIEQSSNNQVESNEVMVNFSGRFAVETVEDLDKSESSRDDTVVNKESLMKDLDSAFNDLLIMEKEGLHSPESENGADEFGSRIVKDMESDSNFRKDVMSTKEAFKNVKLYTPKAKPNHKSFSLDLDTESIANEFLNMLGIEHSPFGLSSESEPESPRELLLRQFEKETLADGNSLFDFDVGYDFPSGSSDFETEEHKGEVETEAIKNTTRAKLIEDLETEALMREWGLNEKAFQNSPPNSSGGFGSPICYSPQEPPQLPPLGEGLEPFVQTKNGGFLRSMNPVLFNSAKNGGRLIMQVSNPVVVPAEMGSGVMDILQNLASVGIEKLSMQANKLMPLEDITGKTVQQIAWEAEPNLEALERQVLLQHEPEVAADASGRHNREKGKSSKPKSKNFKSSQFNDTSSEYVSLEDLAPLAMDKIEALSIEGLRIQSGMSDKDPPSNISSQSIGQISTLEGKKVRDGGSLELEGSAGLQLLDIKEGSDDVDGLMSLSLTLDEWMRLDSGEIVDEEDQISERTSKILAAHHATSMEIFHGGSKGEKKRGKGSNKKCGFLGNNFTVALMVQLRDPLRDYEPVGTPMLALIQVERVFVPPKPKIYSTVSELKKSNEGEEDESDCIEMGKKEEENKQVEESIPQFKITEVHVAGLKTEPENKKLWGSATQKHSGSRWLVANGMGKSNKSLFLKSKPVSSSSLLTTTKEQPGDKLWSISSRGYGVGINGRSWRH